MLYIQFRMLRGHYAKMTRGLFPKRIIRYAGLTEPPMCTSAYLANVRPDHISSSYWFRSKKCSALARPRAGRYEYSPVCPSSVSELQCTVLASFLQSFVFATSLFTAPARPLLTRAAAAERLAGALSGTAPHRSVEDTVGFATSMLSGVTWRSGGPR